MPGMLRFAQPAEIYVGGMCIERKNIGNAGYAAASRIYLINFSPVASKYKFFCAMNPLVARFIFSARSTYTGKTILAVLPQKIQDRFFNFLLAFAHLRPLKTGTGINGGVRQPCWATYHTYYLLRAANTILGPYGSTKQAAVNYHRRNI